MALHPGVEGRLGFDKTPKRGAARVRHDRLSAFAGTWKVQGWQHEGPGRRAGEIAATETFEWLPGGMFMVHRFDGRVGDQDTACIEIIGHDVTSQAYLAHTYYDNGMACQWDMSEKEGNWMLTGSWPIAGRQTRMRCLITLSSDGSTRKARWEHASDDAHWMTFWDLKATRLG